MRTTAGRRKRVANLRSQAEAALSSADQHAEARALADAEVATLKARLAETQELWQAERQAMTEQLSAALAQRGELQRDRDHWRDSAMTVQRNMELRHTDALREAWAHGHTEGRIEASVEEWRAATRDLAQQRDLAKAEAAKHYALAMELRKALLTCREQRDAAQMEIATWKGMCSADVGALKAEVERLRGAEAHAYERAASIIANHPHTCMSDKHCDFLHAAQEGAAEKLRTMAAEIRARAALEGS